MSSQNGCSPPTQAPSQLFGFLLLAGDREHGELALHSLQYLLQAYTDSSHVRTSRTGLSADRPQKPRGVSLRMEQRQRLLHPQAPSAIHTPTVSTYTGHPMRMPLEDEMVLRQLAL